VRVGHGPPGGVAVGRAQGAVGAVDLLVAKLGVDQRDGERRRLDGGGQLRREQDQPLLEDGLLGHLEDRDDHPDDLPVGVTHRMPAAGEMAFPAAHDTGGVLVDRLLAGGEHSPQRGFERRAGLRPEQVSRPAPEVVGRWDSVDLREPVVDVLVPQLGVEQREAERRRVEHRADHVDALGQFLGPALGGVPGALGCLRRGAQPAQYGHQRAAGRQEGGTEGQRLPGVGRDHAAHRQHDQAVQEGGEDQGGDTRGDAGEQVPEGDRGQ
jgi:hypothetical protein